jgi:rhodanese-related sulfurtransferase
VATTLTTEELHARLEAGPVALFDVRGDVEYEQGHIPGAKTAPLGSLVFRVARVMNPDSFVAVYSADEDSELASEATERLENLGMRNVHRYDAGLEGWRAAGHPVVESVHAKVHTQGPVIECRPVVLSAERAARAYGGAFAAKPSAEQWGAGG